MVAPGSAYAQGQSQNHVPDGKGDRTRNVLPPAATGGAGTTGNGIYFVLTSADVNETSGFCTRYCGWHTYGFLNGANIKYSVVGNSDRCPSACAAQSPGPNGTTGIDGMASVIAHELEESVSDPN